MKQLLKSHIKLKLKAIKRIISNGNGYMLHFFAWGNRNYSIS